MFSALRRGQKSSAVGWAKRRRSKAELGVRSSFFAHRMGAGFRAARRAGGTGGRADCPAIAGRASVPRGSPPGAYCGAARVAGVASVFSSPGQLSGRSVADYKRPPRGGDSRGFSGWSRDGMPREKQNNYHPSDREPFMNERQRDYFRNKLLAWREDILREAQETLQHLQDENQNHPDLPDPASSETERAIELRARDRQRKLGTQKEAALRRI